MLQEGGMKFADEVKDIVQYRVLEYYWKRYRDKAMRREKAEIGNREQREGEKDTFLLR